MKILKESSKKVLEIFSKNETPNIQRVDEAVEAVRTFLPTIVYSGTTTVVYEPKQREDVFSRDIIVEKTGFRTKTQKKYFENVYYDKPVNPNFYGHISFTGTTQLTTVS